MADSIVYDNTTNYCHIRLVYLSGKERS